MNVMVRIVLRCLLGVAFFAFAMEGRAAQSAAERLNDIERVAGGMDTGHTAIPKLPEPAVQFYVAPDGSDSNPGDRQKPFASLERARDEIRAIRQRGGLPSGGVVVEIRGGEYVVKQTLALGVDDSGSEDSPITYRAHRGETPVFRGGIRLNGFKPVLDVAILSRLPVEAHGKVLAVDLKPFGVAGLKPLILGGCASGNGFKTHPVNELFFNGDALPMARYPNEGMLHVVDIVENDGHTVAGISGSKVGHIVYDGDRPARWKGDADAMLYGYWFFDWADSYERIASIDTEKHTIMLTPPYHSYGYRKGQRYYAVNLLSEIDMPGEWYLDRVAGVLYLYPPSDVDKATVELSLFDSNMLDMNEASHVQFQGLAWELGCADAIHVNGGAHCLFAGCTVRRFGGNGIEIKGGAAHGIVSCDIYSMGRGGACVAGGDRKTLTPGGHFVENCHIYNLSRVDHTYTPAVLLNGVGNRIAHNLMHHINSSAMRVEGNDHLIEFNEVHDVLLESDDQGGADMFGNATYRGNVYRYNYWHHNGNWRRIGKDLACGQAGIRLDDAISGVFIYGNIFYKTSSGGAGFGGIQIHGGKDNVLANNIFADCTSAISFSHWGADRWKAFVANALSAPAIDADLYQKRYPELCRLAEDNDVNFVLRCLAWKCGEFLRRDKGETVQMDNTLTDDASIFADAARGDFALKSLTPDLKKAGFKKIPFKEIGLYKDAFRHSVPVKEIEAARAQ